MSAPNCEHWVERRGPVEPVTPRFCKFLEERFRGISMDAVQSNEETRVDYSCLSGLLAVEIKTLEGSAEERIHNFTASISDREDWPYNLGPVPLDPMLKRMEGGEQLRHQLMSRVARPIVTHLKKADKQFAAHEAHYPRKNRLRLLTLINEDHPEYAPDVVCWAVSQELNRRSGNDVRYGNIDAVLYITERHAALVGSFISFPLIAVEGPAMEDHDWKGELISKLQGSWAGWSGVPSLKPEGMPSFTTIDPIPDELPRHEIWRRDYKRHRRYAHLSNDELRDFFDQLMVLQSAKFLKNSPIAVPDHVVKEALMQFTFVMQEMGLRGLGMRDFRMMPERMLAAGKAMGLRPSAQHWLAEMFSSSPPPERG